MRDTWADHPDREERLRALWAEGHSTGEIARRLDISKNAVIGRAHRMALPARSSTIKRGPAGAPKEPRAARPKATLPPLPSVQIPAEQYTDGNRRKPTSSIPNRGAVRGATLVFASYEPTQFERVRETAVPRRARGTCCWPIGEPRTREFRYCDDPAMRGAYCEAHAQIAYVGGRPAGAAQAA